MSTWMCQPKLVVRMPFTYVLKSILRSQNTTNCGEIFNVLVKECNLMVGSCSRPDCIQNNRDACRSPKTEELSTCFNVWVVENTSRDKIKFSLINNGRQCWVARPIQHLRFCLHKSHLPLDDASRSFNNESKSSPSVLLPQKYERCLEVAFCGLVAFNHASTPVFSSV